MINTTLSQPLPLYNNPTCPCALNPKPFPFVLLTHKSVNLHRKEREEGGADEKAQHRQH
jgi:hypothetical protein